MYLLKHIPEDFVVREIPPEDFIVRENPLVKPIEQGKYFYFLLRKKNLNTMEAVQAIARALHIPEKNIGFAGSKDKRAITEQFCSLLGARKERLEKIQISGMQMAFLWYGNTPISLGYLQGNHFEIVIRNMEEKEFPKSAAWIPNYFDEQRFGRENVVLGKCLIKKQFAEAVAMLKNEDCEKHLLTHAHDYIGALKLLPLRLLRLYLNAYQSYLWNETLAGYLKEKCRVVKEIPYSQGKLIFSPEIFSELEIPLIGFDYERKKNKETEIILEELMKRERISPQDFILKQIPQLTLEGEMRKAFVLVKEVIIETAEKDEFHPGKKKVKVSFTLPKGSYATMVIRGMMIEGGK